MLKDFKEFAIRGDGVHMAVGIVIGAVSIDDGLVDNSAIGFPIVASAVFLPVRTLNKLKECRHRTSFPDS